MKAIVKRVFVVGVLSVIAYFVWNNLHPSYTRRAVAGAMIGYAVQNKAFLETPVDSVKLFSATKYFVDNGYIFNRVVVLRNESHDVTAAVFLDKNGGMHCLVFPKNESPDACKK